MKPVPRALFGLSLVCVAGSAFFGYWLFIAYRVDWDGVSCCDPLEDIGVIWVFAIAPLFIAMTLALAARDIHRNPKRPYEA